MEEFTGVFELIDPHLILVDRAYQRTEKQNLIDAIAAYPLWEAFGTVTCFVRVREDSQGKERRTYYCVDGQQRIKGILKTEKPPKAVPVISYVMHNVRDEAEVFVRINEFRKALSALEKHKGKLVAEDDAALAIERAVTAAGFTIGEATSRGEGSRTIHAIAALNWIYNLIGEEGVTQTLVQIRDAWPDDRTGIESQMLKAIAQVIAEQQGSEKNGGYNRSTLTKNLQATNPAALFRKAEALRFDVGGSRAVNLRRALKTLAKV
jgi:Family of unknown function (DUF6551)